MTTKEFIERYDIKEFPGGKVGTHKIPKDPEERAKLGEEIKARKSAIIEYFEQERAAAKAQIERRESIINSIPGMAEIKAKRREYAKWHMEFNRLMDTEDGASVMQEAPKGLEEIEEKYPDAVFILKVMDDQTRTNYELVDIADKTMDLLYSGKTIEEVRAYYEKENSAFVERHMWD